MTNEEMTELLLTIIIILLSLLPITQGFIESDGLCPLFIFTPFTIASDTPSGTLTGENENITNKGFSQMSAALLAMEHFNARNATVVPELANFTSCNVRFDTNKSKIFDTGSITHLASESLWQADIMPCAMAGPYNDVPAIDLSVMALSSKTPLVVHRAHHLRITSDDISPYSSQVYPGTISTAHKLVDFLLDKGRSDYIGVLYALTETGNQRQEALALELDHSHMEWMSAGYFLDLGHDHEEGRGQVVECEDDHGRAGREDACHDEHARKRVTQVVAFNITFDEPKDQHNNAHDEESHHEHRDIDEEGGEHGDDDDEDEDDDHNHESEEEHGHGEHESSVHEDEHSVLGALKKIKESGYRTVVVAMEFPDGETQLIADAAEELGMNKGDYLWVWNGMFEPSVAHSENSNITKLLAGSALLMPFSDAFLRPESDSFAMAWYSQGKDAVDRLNAANPINPGEVGYVYAKDDWFQTVELEWGSDFLYDAVMTAGIGACLAEQVSNETVSGTDHQSSIRRTTFTGATGLVAFGGERKDEIGARDPSTVSWAEINVLPPRSGWNETEYFSIAGVYKAGSRHWHSIQPFVYRDGRNVPPELLRDEGVQNYLSNGLRIMGLTLMGIALLGALMCASWVFLCRNHRVLRASQPVFLYLIAFGAAVETLTILTISNDESYGWSTEALSAACMANPWLLSTGHIIIYASLFTKLWRVNKVLQFSRRKIEVRHVAGPMVIIVMMAVLVLSLLTALDPLRWTRVEIDSYTGDSIGQCNSENFAAFIIPLIVLMLIPTALTALMAWKTMDVDEAYAESKWIFSMILVQLEVVVVAVPLVFILRDVSTDGRYLGFMFMLWVFPMSTLLLIFLPKYAAYRMAVRGGNAGGSVIRGQRRGVVVSGGISSSLASTTKRKTPSSLEETFVGQEGAGHVDPASSVIKESGNGDASAVQGEPVDVKREDAPPAMPAEISAPDGIGNIESDDEGDVAVPVFDDSSTSSNIEDL